MVTSRGKTDRQSSIWKGGAYQPPGNSVAKKWKGKSADSRKTIIIRRGLAGGNDGVAGAGRKKLLVY